MSLLVTVNFDWLSSPDSHFAQARNLPFAGNTRFVLLEVCTGHMYVVNGLNAREGEGGVKRNNYLRFANTAVLF